MQGSREADYAGCVRAGPWQMADIFFRSSLPAISLLSRGLCSVTASGGNFHYFSFSQQQICVNIFGQQPAYGWYQELLYYFVIACIPWLDPVQLLDMVRKTLYRWGKNTF